MKLDALQRRALLRDPAGWIATGLGSGLSPIAPGTAGSLAALLPWFALRELPWFWVLGAIALLFVLGVWASNRVVARLGVSDPGCIVVDEVVGQWLALSPLLLGTHDWRWIVAGFVLFRLFDVWKPWPVSWADCNVKGGLGVMLDDVIAGAMSALVMGLMLRLQ